ncbi:CidA/LrgA family protein [Vibrio cholerae]|uniref:CidA/LrgA family protein n=1 Tax=Vibrio cholerae TaxID=666 RepID=UPI000BA95917|nr:CidA/LrgA family protein [Vibrio cholerae]EIA3111396.1 CidA/LrgA family protein [Vibrio cholerae]EJL6546591.1 CidA/LrgA family protein [Vibrio cholerae]EJL6998972.1 CidA/LrgA family protein [Vibrio cholerae]EKF9163025.1 CidA/LrgA family protein [Vibrio cholerae]EKF9979477.1 CidA/LrgA family protein [Vibrio cholerae]
MQNVTRTFQFKHSLLIVVQVAALSLIWFFSDWLVNQFHLPLPANLTGMLILLLLVMLKVVNVEWFRRGASWLLAEMLLFFVPAVVAVVNYQDLMRQEGIKIAVVLVASTILVIASTAWVVDKMHRVELVLARRKRRQIALARSMEK